MDRLQTKVAECEYREPDRLLMEQFIDGPNDDDMTDDILREVTTLEDIYHATNKHALSLTHRVEAQRAQRSIQNNIE